MKHQVSFVISVFAHFSIVRCESNISAPADFSTETCNLDTSPSRTGQVSWNSSAECEAIRASVISYNDTRESLTHTPWGILIKRVWIVTNGCDQSVNQTQLINITVPRPRLNLPNDVSTTCADTPHPNTTGLPSVVLQPCHQHSVTFSYSDTKRSNDSCPEHMEFIRRNFDIQESWGRSSYHLQNITLYAYVSPKIACRGDDIHVLITRGNYPYLSPEWMHLNNPSCNASSYNSTHVTFNIPLHSCGTVRHVTNDELTFENKVVAAVGSPGDVTSLWRDVEFLVNCSYQRRVSVIGPSYTITRNKVQVKEAGYGNFTFSLLLYRSNLYDWPYQDADFPLSVNLRHWLYVEVEVESSQSQLVLFVDTCKAKSALSANSVDYTFINNGCAAVPSLVFNYQLSSHQRFSMQAFHFLNGLSTVYLQCEVLVCHVNDTSSRCNSDCESRAKRRRRQAEWTKNRRASETYTLSLGPITELTDKSNRGSDTAQQESNIVPAIIGAASGILVTAIVGLTVVFILRLIRRRRGAVLDVPADNTGPIQSVNPALDVAE